MPYLDLYALQNENLFSENDYNDDLNNELVQAIEYYESLNAVPLRFSSLSQEQIGKTKTEIHGSLSEQLENMGDKYKRRRPCEVILEEEVAEAERMEQPANSKIQRKADTREEQIIKREGQAKKKVKR